MTWSSRARRRAGSPTSGSTTTTSSPGSRSWSGSRSRRSGAGTRAHRSRRRTSRILAGAGPAWSCGYDDHSLPPVRPGGNQGYHTACLWAVMGAMAGLYARQTLGFGQHVDVSMHAAANVTTEAATYEWLVAQATVQRQTFRHAAVRPTQSRLIWAADGRAVINALPRSAAEFRAVIDWLVELDLADQIDEFFFLEMGVERGGLVLTEVEVRPGGRGDLPSRARRLAHRRRAPPGQGVLRRARNDVAFPSACCSRRRRSSTTSTSSPAASPSRSATKTWTGRSCTPVPRTTPRRHRGGCAGAPRTSGEHTEMVLGALDRKSQRGPDGEVRIPGDRLGRRPLGHRPRFGAQRTSTWRWTRRWRRLPMPGCARKTSTGSRRCPSETSRPKRSLTRWGCSWTGWGGPSSGAQLGVMHQCGDGDRVRDSAVTYSSSDRSSAWVGSWAASPAALPVPEGPWEWHVPFHEYSAVNLMAMQARRHMHEYGTTKEQLGWIALTARFHAGLNDQAVLRVADDHGRLPERARDQRSAGPVRLRPADRRRGRTRALGGRLRRGLPASSGPLRGGRVCQPRRARMGAAAGLPGDGGQGRGAPSCGLAPT